MTAPVPAQSLPAQPHLVNVVFHDTGEGSALPRFRPRPA